MPCPLKPAAMNFVFGGLAMEVLNAGDTCLDKREVLGGVGGWVMADGAEHGEDGDMEDGVVHGGVGG